MGYIWPKLRGILGKTVGYIIGYKWQYLKINGYIKQKLRDIFGKIMGYIWQKLWDIFAKTMGYIWINYGI